MFREVNGETVEMLPTVMSGSVVRILLAAELIDSAKIEELIESGYVEIKTKGANPALTTFTVN